MSEVENPTELFQRGQAAASIGLRSEARALLRRAVQADPGNVQGWLALAGVEDDPASKMSCFDKILELNPDHVEATLGREMLQARAGSVEAKPAAENLEDVIAAASLQLDEAMGPPQVGEVPLDDEVFYCANHSSVETMLRCNRCSKPICTRCAVQTPVGYRCRECIGQQRAVYYSGGGLDYVLGAVISLVLGGVASFFMSMLGGWFFALILGPAAGVGTAELVRLAVRRRRSRYLWLVVAGGLIVGALAALILSFRLWSILTIGIFVVLAVGAATARLR